MPATPSPPARPRASWACLLAAAFVPLAAGATSALPPEVAQALQRARVPADALAVVVQQTETRRTVLAVNERVPMNPASLAKLATTAAALDLLGPAWQWSTPVWLHGPVRDGVLEGNLVVKGSGDPKLVVERVWQLLQRVQAAGVRTIRGDIVLDASAFAPGSGSPADFDGETTRPYNVRADALLLNFKAVTYTFTPDPARGIAVIAAEPPLAGTMVDTAVPLSAGPCEDWRSALKASFADAGHVRFAGSYALACGVLSWPVADVQPATYNRRLVEALWRGSGGQLGGIVREGAAPAERPTFELRSPPLAEVVRDINKHSNNVMAQQLFLTLAFARDGTRAASPQAARDVLQLWLAENLGDAGADAVVDNGSGLSRDGRFSALGLARLLQYAWDSPWMPELVSSLPIAGVDGTLRRARPARAHLKTGSLRDVVGVAGYVLANDGRRYALVALVNHPQAQAARPAIEALVQWTLHEAPRAAAKSAN